MDTLNSIIRWIMSIITGGTVAIILVSIFCIIKSPDEKETYIKRIKNAMVFLIVAFLIYSIKDLVINYFGTPTFKMY